MMKNNVVGLTISLVVGIIMVGTLLAPTISSTVSGNVTEYTNDGDASYTINGVEDFSIYNTSGRYWVINGETIQINDSGVPLVTTDQFAFIKSDINGNYMYLRDSTGSVVIGGSANTYKFSIEYTASTNTAVFTIYTDLTGETVDTTYTYSCSHVIEYDPEGDYTAISTEGSADEVIEYYVNNANQIYAGGAYTSGSLDTAYFANGESVTLGVDDYSGSATATISAIDGVEGVYLGSAYTVSVSDGTTTETFTPYTVFVPITVSGETSSQSMINGLLPVLVVMTVVGILAVAARGVTRD